MKRILVLLPLVFACGPDTKQKKNIDTQNEKIPNEYFGRFSLKFNEYGNRADPNFCRFSGPSLFKDFLINEGLVESVKEIEANSDCEMNITYESHIPIRQLLFERPYETQEECLAQLPFLNKVILEKVGRPSFWSYCYNGFFQYGTMLPDDNKWAFYSYGNAHLDKIRAAVMASENAALVYDKNGFIFYLSSVGAFELPVQPSVLWEMRKDHYYESDLSSYQMFAKKVEDLTLIKNRRVYAAHILYTSTKMITAEMEVGFDVNAFTVADDLFDYEDMEVCKAGIDRATAARIARGQNVVASACQRSGFVKMLFLIDNRVQL